MTRQTTSFTRKAERSPQLKITVGSRWCGLRRSIVRSVIELAHSLGVRVVAEGVEDAETSARLASYGCDYLQGFYLGRPAVPAEVTGLLTAAVS